MDRSDDARRVAEPGEHDEPVAGRHARAHTGYWKSARGDVVRIVAGAVALLLITLATRAWLVPEPIRLRVMGRDEIWEPAGLYLARAVIPTVVSFLAALVIFLRPFDSHRTRRPFLLAFVFAVAVGLAAGAGGDDSERSLLFASASLSALAGAILAWLCPRSCPRPARAIYGLAMASIPVWMFACGYFCMCLGGSADRPAGYVPEPEGSHRLVQFLKETTRHEEERISWELRESELTTVVNAALVAMGFPHQAHITINSDTVLVKTLVSLPLQGRRYVPLRCEIMPVVEQGRLRFDIRGLWLGNLPVPDGVATWYANELLRLVAEDPEGQKLLDAMHQCDVSSGSLFVEMDAQYVREDLVQLVRSRFGSVNVDADHVLEYAKHVYATLDQLPRGDTRHAAIVQNVFGLAHDRSQQGDAARENEAAIMAMALMCGHEHLSLAVGIPDDDRERLRYLRRKLGRVSEYGRVDLVQHFWISAALAVLTSDRVSDTAALLKEFSDVDPEGSGFSFPDLMASRAGVRFARFATSVDGAPRVQERLASFEWQVTGLLPPIDGLQESLNELDLQTLAPGGTEEVLRAMEAEIDQRITEHYRQLWAVEP